MPKNSLLLPSQPTPLATLVVAVVTAVSIMAGSLLVIGHTPADAPAKTRPSVTRVACTEVPARLQCV